MFKNRSFLLYLILLTIFVLALFLRFYKLSEFPVGFDIDEASKGYTAYSLLKTERDDNNNFLPLYIDIFGDNSPPGYHYVTIIPIALLGLTEFAVRFPGALFGAFSVLAIFFLSYSMFESKKVGIFSALFLAISPWHINLSRASSEGIIALFFIILGFFLTFRSLKTQSIKYLIFGTIILAISFFFYQTPRVFVPLFFLALSIFFLLIWKIQVTSRYKKAFICALLLLSLLDFILVFVVSGGTGRFFQVNIFSYPETRLVIEEQIREDGVSGVQTLVTRFFHNKGINFFLTYVSNYFEYFSWNFLFVKGLPSGYFVPNMGVLYFAELPFILFGIFWLAFDKNKMYRIPLLWLTIAPTTAAIAIDVNNMQRALIMFLILEIIAAYGLVRLFTNVIKQRRLVLVVFATLLFLCNIFYFFHQYFVHTKVHRPWYRYNGAAEMIQTVKKSYDLYDKIIITKSMGGIYPLVQFYMQYDPKIYQQEGSPKDRAYTGFGKFFFVPIDCPSLEKNKKFPNAKRIIYINRGICPQDANYKETIIYREDNSIALHIVYGDKKIISE